MKYYEVKIVDIDGDEWTLYGGYRKEEACRICHENNNACRDEGSHSEVHVFEIDKPFEALNDDEQSAMYCCYDIIENTFVGMQIPDHDGWWIETIDWKEYVELRRIASDCRDLYRIVVFKRAPRAVVWEGYGDIFNAMQELNVK